MKTDKKINEKPVSYKIKDNGYIIYLDGKPWISQLDEYGKPISESMSYEENCLAHIEELTRVEEGNKSLEERLEALEQKVNEFTYIEGALGDGVIEIVKKEQMSAGDYTNPIKYESGMSVEQGKWYYLNDKDLPREAIKSGKPSGFEDGAYLV